jgi:hypothetical protein
MVTRHKRELIHKVMDHLTWECYTYGYYSTCPVCQRKISGAEHMSSRSWPETAAHLSPTSGNPPMWRHLAGHRNKLLERWLIQNILGNS